MPFYDFFNSKTEELRTDVMMSISSMETFLLENPDWKIHISVAPPIGDSVRLGIRKTPESFRDLLKNIKNSKVNRGNTIKVEHH